MSFSTTCGYLQVRDAGRAVRSTITRMSKRSIEDVAAANPDELETPTVVDFAYERVGQLHYLFSGNEGGDGITAFTWTPSVDGARLLYRLMHLPNDSQGYPTPHVELFNAIVTLVHDPSSRSKDAREALKEIAKVIPTIKTREALGILVEMPAYTSPPPVPCIPVMCQGWC